MSTARRCSAKMAEISVVIPSYNHEAYIRQAIDSVLAQTWSDLELIIIDDGSSDNSFQIIREYQDPRVRAFTQQNQGAHAAINRGIELATGRYVSILNSDDAYLPDRLEKLVALLKSNPDAGLAASYIQVIDPSGAPLGIKHAYKDLEPWPLAHPELSFRAGEDPFSALLTENHLATTSNFLFDRSRYNTLGGFRSLRYTHDWDFALRAARAAGGKLCIAPQPLLKYRLHSHNTIRENKAAMVFEICWCLAMHLPTCLQALKPPLNTGNGQVSRLLHSIYTYRADAVLATLLALGIANDETMALELLIPRHPVRLECIDYINSVLDEQTVLSPPSLSLRLGRRLRNYLGRLTTKIV